MLLTDGKSLCVIFVKTSRLPLFLKGTFNNKKNIAIVVIFVAIVVIYIAVAGTFHSILQCTAIRCTLNAAFGYGTSNLTPNPSIVKNSTANNLNEGHPI